MDIACGILKTIFTENSSIHNLNHCFGKLHGRQLKRYSMKPLPTYQKSMNVLLNGFCNMLIQSTGLSYTLSGNVMAISHPTLQNHSIHGFWKHEKCPF